MADRKSLQTYVTPEAHEGWHQWCAAEGVSFSALIEVVGTTLAGEAYNPVSGSLQAFIAEARSVDAARRSRS